MDIKRHTEDDVTHFHVHEHLDVIRHARKHGHRDHDYEHHEHNGRTHSYEDSTLEHSHSYGIEL